MSIGEQPSKICLLPRADWFCTCFYFSVSELRPSVVEIVRRVEIVRTVELIASFHMHPTWTKSSIVNPVWNITMEWKSHKTICHILKQSLFNTNDNEQLICFRIWHIFFVWPRILRWMDDLWQAEVAESSFEVGSWYHVQNLFPGASQRQQALDLSSLRLA